MRYFYYLIIVCMLSACGSQEKLDLGIRAYEQKDYDVAVVFLNEYVSENPGSDEALEYLTRSHEHLGQWQQARLTAQNWIAATEEHATAYSIYGHILDQLNDRDSSHIYFIKAYRLDTTSVYVNLNLAAIYCYYWKSYKLAIQHSNTALIKDPHNVDVLDVKANAFLGLQLYDSAYAIAKIIQTVAPEKAYSYTIFGLICYEQDKYDCALEQQGKAIGHQPDNLDLYLNRARTYGSMGEYKSALPDLDKAVGLDAKSVDAYGMRAYAYRELGQMDKFCADLHIIAKLAPDHEAVNYLDECK